MKKMLHEIVTIIAISAAMILIGNAGYKNVPAKVPDYVQSEFAKQRENTVKGKHSLVSKSKATKKAKTAEELKAKNYNLQDILEYKDFAAMQLRGLAPSTTLETKEGIVDVNIATLDELCKIKGIGKSIGFSILKKKKSMGYFRSIDDLIAVKGIGEKKLATIKKAAVNTKAN